MMTITKKIGISSLLFIISIANAASLGHMIVSDPVLGSRTIVYEKINEFAVAEGDILLAKTRDLDKAGAVFRPKIGGNRWAHGVIPFEMSEDLPLMNKLAVLQAIAHWQQYTALEFVELTSKNRAEYKDYIAFIPAAGTTCSSYVGKMGGKQEINLSPRCTTMNTVHEIGHALGLWHEQSRADRANYIRIVWENIDEDHRYNFDQQLTDGKDFGEYDYLSIMHYGAYAFSKNGEKTIIPLMDNVEIGQRVKLSEKDIAAVKAMYPET
ncbi:peptidase [Legionella quinlivanii]|uniref:Peptidase n=1 Tax=Legionella quinlivanii TaxID=45073 RepID=A0A364LL26_9GAMM|nr:Dot/Icm T4SS effector Zinc-dependent metalloprotease LegP [Legionella quinlivanii]RAP37425.1 peptidase [Legionella quinlivanii]